VRTALFDLFVVLSGAQHPIQPNGQLVRDRHFGDAVVLVHRQAQILSVPVRIVPLGKRSRLHQQPAQQFIALLADVAKAALVRTS
jgi:hypothetical protein